MLPSRIRLEKDTSEILKQMKARTGLTPNVLARFAFAKSLEAGDVIDGDVADASTATEMNMSTLFGDLRLHFETLLRQRYPEIDSEQYAHLIAGHIKQGTMAIRHVKSLAGILELVP